MEDTTKVGDVFSDRERNLAGLNKSATSVLLASLRTRYPDWSVTLTSAHEAPLRPFAEAGNATAILDLRQDKYVQYHSMAPVYRRVSRDPGKVVGRETFGKYDYTWDSKSFIVYFAECAVELQGMVHNYFILAKRDEDSDGDAIPKAVSDLIAAASHWNLQPHDEIFVFDQQRWVKDKELYKSVMSSTWDDVILGAEMKNNLIQDVEGFFDNKGAYEEFAVPWKRGLIFHGTPGNGKTISLKALMRSLYNRPDPIPTLYVKSLAGCGNEFYAIRLIFDKARRTAPCLLIFEDLDSLIKNNVKSFFLNEVDGLEDNDGLLMIGSTNYLDRLDPGISKRPSRFDRKYHFALPAKPERARYCQFWQRKLRNNDKVDLPEELCDAIAQITEGFSFAYLKEAFVTALLLIVGAKKTNPIDLEMNGDLTHPPAPKAGSSTLTLPTPTSDTTNPTQTNGGTNQPNGKEEETKPSSNPKKESGDEAKDEAELEDEPEEDHISKEEKEANEKAHKALDDILLGRVIRRQIATLHMEMEDARKSVEESEKNAGGQQGGSDRTCLYLSFPL